MNPRFFSIVYGMESVQSWPLARSFPKKQINAINVRCRTRNRHKEGQCSNLRFALALNEPLRNDKSQSKW